MAILLNFGDYLLREAGSSDYQKEEIEARTKRLLQFPHAVMVELSYPELDFANRWCWQQFGPGDGDCSQKDSEYRVCLIEEPHSHSGVWTNYWFEKTDYNFGVNEWYFAHQANCELFLEFVPRINWGESFPDAKG
ncbi:MAG TPA: hypothetical protein VGI40_01470 [Pirellulaceae bacterium]|jgi:hypothetical protein